MPPKRLLQLRKKIDSIDDKIFKLLCKRFSYSPQVAASKSQNGLPLFQKDRLGELLGYRAQFAKKMKMNMVFAKKLMRLIHDESLRLQKKSLLKKVKGHERK